MSRHAAILGLGQRGAGWAETCLTSGWQVSTFDPDAGAGAGLGRDVALSRRVTISETVHRAELIITALPERLELVQMMLQRAQAAAPEDAVFCVASDRFDIEALQSSAIRPGQVFRLSHTDPGNVLLEASQANAGGARKAAKLMLADLMANRALVVDAAVATSPPGAESA